MRRAATSTGGGDVLIRHELARYLARDVMENSDDFSLPQYWWRRDSTITGTDSGAIVAKAILPHLGLIAHLYHHGIESASCQDERDVSVLALLVSN